MATERKRREFRVVFEGGELPDDVAGRIEEAIHRVVLDELAASTDVQAKFVPQPLIGGGGLVGLQFLPEETRSE